MLATLPQNDPVLADARYVLMHNPAMEKIVIDISLAREDMALLTDCAAFVEARLRESGLFKQVGLRAYDKAHARVSAVCRDGPAGAVQRARAD